MAFYLCAGLLAVIAMLLWRILLRLGEIETYNKATWEAVRGGLFGDQTPWLSAIAEHIHKTASRDVEG